MNNTANAINTISPYRAGTHVRVEQAGAVAFGRWVPHYRNGNFVSGVVVTNSQAHVHVSAAALADGRAMIGRAR
jgi:hypothetical protein